MQEPNNNTKIAVDFMRLIVEGQIDKAYDRYISTSGKHHNLFTKASFAELREGMKEAHVTFPKMKLEIQHTIGDGDFVAIHSHIAHRPGDAGYTVVHIFRFEKDKIVELWDLAQEIKSDSVNKDGAF
jgi:predicted SnoaL-like aldol condensation-catalyzing enzyme